MAFEKGSDFAAELKEGEEIGDAGRVNAGGRWRFMRPLSPYEGERGITNQRIRTQGGGPCGTWPWAIIFRPFGALGFGRLAPAEIRG